MAWDPGDAFRVKDTTTVRNCGMNPVVGRGYVCFVAANQISFFWNVVARSGSRRDAT